MRYLKIYALLYFAVNLSVLANNDSNTIKKTIIGFIETGYLAEIKLPIKMKIDSGAKTASLGVKNIKYFTKNDRRWVRFTLLPRKHNKYYINLNPIVIEKPIIKFIKIKKRKPNWKIKLNNLYSKRPVVNFELCLDNMKKIIEVNLANRKHFNYQLLLGRKAVNKFGKIIDPEQSFLTKYSCTNET